jgi:hypothetical protein
VAVIDDNCARYHKLVGQSGEQFTQQMRTAAEAAVQTALPDGAKFGASVFGGDRRRDMTPDDYQQ